MTTRRSEFRRNMPRARYLIALAAALIYMVVSIMSFVSAADAHPSSVSNAPAAGSVTDDNPWVFNQTNAALEGLRINAASGPNGQVFVIYDYLGQPIFTCNKAGGCAVLGDNFGVHDGADIFNAQVLLTPDFPPTVSCPRINILRIGDPNGGIRRCTDIDPSAAVVLEWRRIL